MKNQNVELVCSIERLKEIISKPGPYKEYTSSDYQVKYYDAPAIEGIELPEGFPIPETFFKVIYDEAELYINRFPNCCKHHKKLKQEKWFKKNDYAELPIKAATQLFYTTKYMEERVQNKDWHKEITDYIESNIMSFGQLPLNYGSPVGSFFYIKGIRIWLTKFSKLPPKFKKQIVEYLDNRNKETDTPSLDLNLLYFAYQKWLSIFPFDIEYFKTQKEHFRKIFPLFTGEVEHNRFMGTVVGTPNTIEGLTAFLVKTTGKLLEKVNSWELAKQGLISDVSKHQFDLINEAHRVKQTLLLKTFSSAEKQYVELLITWLQNEKEYFKEIAPLLNTNIEKVVTITEQIKTELTKHGFCELPLVKKLNQSQQSALFKLIGANELPYQIAMLDYLGFLKYLLEQYFKSKYALHGQLGKWLGGVNARTVKGNMNVLIPNSKESKTKYTSYLHKETVKKDYQNLK